jgi:hypothetical protein
MKFVSNIDLQKNELQNAVIQNLPSDPSTDVSKEGQVYYNTTDQKFKQFNGTEWVVVGKDFTVTDGNGLTSTATGDTSTQISLGTPSSITNTSDNSTTESSHTHKIEFTPVTSPIASGTSTSFIDTVSQGANGRISATKKSLPEASTAAKGIIQLASDTEATTGTDTTKAVTPAQLKSAKESAISQAKVTITVDNGLSGGGTGNAITISGVDASATAKGVVQLAEDTDTTSTTKVVTAAQLEAAKQAAIEAAEVTVTAGNGLTGGGTGNAITLTLATPNTVSTSSKNEVTASGHTHALTLPAASETVAGVVKRANNSDITAGTDTEKFVTPAQLKTVADGKVAANQAITGATHTKITYDSKGLITGGSDLTASDIPNLSAIYTPLTNTNKNVVTAVAIPAAGGTAETPSDTVKINVTTTNINSGESTTVGTNIALANENNAGLMSYSDKRNISSLQQRVGQLENSNIRLQYTAKPDPTKDEIAAFVVAAGYNDPKGITVVVQETGHNWHYYNNTGWQDDGVVGVSEFTNDTAGIIKGVAQEGKIYAEGGGIGSVYGWDNLKTLVNSKLTANTNITAATDFSLVKYDAKGLVTTGKAPATLTVNGTAYDPKGNNVSVTTLQKKVQAITGDGVQATFTVAHTFGLDVTCQVFLKGQDGSNTVYELVMVDMLLSNNSVKIAFAQAPARGQEFKVVITG